MVALTKQTFGHGLITKQTKAGNYLYNAVYIFKRKFTFKKLYLAILFDHVSQSPETISSSQGGIDIKTVAKEHPETVSTTYININVGFTNGIAHGGLTMATIDVKLNGNTPANFLDISGRTTSKAIRKTFELIIVNPKIIATLNKTVALSVIHAFISIMQHLNLKIPIIAHLQGTNVAEGSLTNQWLRP